jgi:hypothetical protein
LHYNLWQLLLATSNSSLRYYQKISAGARQIVGTDEVKTNNAQQLPTLSHTSLTGFVLYWSSIRIKVFKKYAENRESINRLKNIFLLVIFFIVRNFQELVAVFEPMHAGLKINCALIWNQIIDFSRQTASSEHLETISDMFTDLRSHAALLLHSRVFLENRYQIIIFFSHFSLDLLDLSLLRKRQKWFN